MLNVHSAGKEPYLIASPPKPRTFSDELILYLLVLVDVVKLIVLTVLEGLKLPFTVCLKSGQKVINGQNALITGGANGIGRAIALELAKNGCNVIIADVDEKAAEKTLDMLKKYDVKAIAITTDVSNPSEVANLKEAVADSLESVDILVNNAGLMPLISLREGAPVDVERIVDVNLNANFWTVRAFLPDMIKRRRGHVVQISSMSALHPIAGGCIYTATKFAVNGLMQALEEEMRQEGLGDCIDFTTVFPYFVSTRRDLMNILNLRFPAITAQQVAEATVRGVFCRQRRVTVPRFDGILTTFVQSLPNAVQCLIRDYVMREPEARVIKNPYLYVG